MQSIRQKSRILNNTEPNVEDDWLFYVALPYRYNPEESFRFAKYYRNLLINLGVYSYNPICETHVPHGDYMKLMAGNLDSGDELKDFTNALDMFYIEEDLMKMEMLNRGSSHGRKFAVLMGVGWNLKFPMEDPVPKNAALYGLYNKYKDYNNVMVNPISMGVLSEYFWSMQNGVPIYDLGIFVSEFELKQVQYHVIEDQSLFWKDARNMGLKLE